METNKKIVKDSSFYLLLIFSLLCIWCLLMTLILMFYAPIWMTGVSGCFFIGILVFTFLGMRALKREGNNAAN